jgi:Flp pilus assembly protein TadG
MGAFRSRLAALLRAFGADRNGATALEFAFILPPLVFMMMAIFQIGLVFTASQVLEDATAEFGRLIRTGQAQGQSMTQQAFRTAFCERIAVFMTCDDHNLLIDVQVLPSFGSVDLDWPVDDDGNFTNAGGYQLGAKEETVLIRVFYQYPILIPFMGASLGDLSNGRRLLAASSAFRNEPF